MTIRCHTITALAVAALMGVALPSTDLRGQEKGDPSEYIRDVTRTTRTVRLTFKAPDDTSLSPEVVADKDGTLRLAHSVLLVDEMGATDYRQSERLSERVQARKVFRLDSDDITSAELFLFGEAKSIAINGNVLWTVKPLVSTGWTRAKVPLKFLKAGENEFVFSGGGSLLIEPGRPGHSFKSRDGGRTWSAQELGAKNSLSGEYIVRLRLGRYAPRGRVTSPVTDSWIAEEDKIPIPGKTEWFNSDEDLNKGQPEGTRLTAWRRTGSTPVPDATHWTDWRKLDGERKPDATTAGHRWAQLRYDLVTTRPQSTPRVKAFRLYFGSAGSNEQPKEWGTVKVLSPSASVRPPLLSSVPFVYQQPSPRLKLLREKYQLDKVIAPGKTEMEQLMLLRYWVRNQCHRGWASHPALWIPPWDALLILESRDRPDALVMCTHYACVFTQCCLALGWNARHCILDHHCVSEVWVDQHRKWVMMDTGNSAERADVGLHFECDGVPLSARKLMLLHRGGKTDGVRVCFTPARLAEKIASLCRPAPPSKTKLAPRADTIPLAELKTYPVCQLDNYRRYAFPPRNNFLDSLYPGELEQGFSNYFYDGYCWVGDSPDDPRISPEYSRHLSPDRPQDIDWEVNAVRLHLSRTAKAGEVQVDVESHVPNLARLEKDTAGNGKPAWAATPARFVWKLKPGRNVLRVRGVNHWERAGHPDRVEVEWQPPR